MNIMYDTFLHVNAQSNDKLSEQMKSISKDEKALQNVFANIYDCLLEMKDIRDRVFISFFEGEDLYKKIDEFYHVKKNSILHSKFTDTINTLSTCLLYEGLESLYLVIYNVLRITRHEFVLYWSVCLSSGAINDLAKNYIKKTKVKYGDN